MDPARYETHLWTQMTQTMGLLLIAYLPLQIGAILIIRHWLARVDAGLPIVLMLPVMITGFQTKTYEVFVLSLCALRASVFQSVVSTTRSSVTELEDGKSIRSRSQVPLGNAQS